MTSAARAQLPSPTHQRFPVSARAENHRKGPLSALRAHTSSQMYKTIYYGKREGRLTASGAPGPSVVQSLPAADGARPGSPPIWCQTCCGLPFSHFRTTWVRKL